jgi:tRNA-splicing endonuclease subunit Sen15
VSGLPPRRVYVHPDEQVEILKAEHETGIHIVQHAEQEWVLPTHISEKWNLKAFGDVFDAIDTVPAVDEVDVKDSDDQSQVGKQWRGKHRQKRLLLATLHDDSTVVYYIMHDGIVKPRQN